MAQYLPGERFGELREIAEASLVHRPKPKHQRIKPAPNPEVLEAANVKQTVALTATVRRLGAMRLLLARMDWERLFSSANPPGACTPDVARSTLTRQAIRDERARQAARRANSSAGRNRAWDKLMKAAA